MTYLRRLFAMMNTVPFLIFLLVLLLFASGYLSNLFYGPDKFVEESAEYFLRHHFKTDVEFSPEERGNGR